MQGQKTAAISSPSRQSRSYTQLITRSHIYVCIYAYLQQQVFPNLCLIVGPDRTYCSLVGPTCIQAFNTRWSAIIPGRHYLRKHFVFRQR